MPKTPQLAPFAEKEQLLYSDPPPMMSELLTLSVKQSMEEALFNPFYPQWHYFGHYPKLMTIGEGLNVDGRVN